MFTLQNSEPGSPLVLHDEPIYCNDKIVGRTTSGNYSFNYKKNMVFGYINLSSLNKDLSKITFQLKLNKNFIKQIYKQKLFTIQII
jgi:4-methylaminobutanoate oxidase (formaldehyde-forming)